MVWKTVSQFSFGTLTKHESGDFNFFVGWFHHRQDCLFKKLNKQGCFRKLLTCHKDYTYYFFLKNSGTHFLAWHEQYKHVHMYTCTYKNCTFVKQTQNYFWWFYLCASCVQKFEILWLKKLAENVGVWPKSSKSVSYQICLFMKTVTIIKKANTEGVLQATLGIVIFEYRHFFFCF